MRNKPVVKGRTIGEGRPLVCVPIIEQTEEGILREAAALAKEESAEMVEWRADWYAFSEDEEKILSFLPRLREALPDKPLLYTYRSVRQGGVGKCDPVSLGLLQETVAKSGYVDFVDFEYFEHPEAANVVKCLQEAGTLVVSSHHDFEKTPKTERMASMLDTMQSSGADIVKLAVMPLCQADLFALISVTGDFHAKYPDIPIITMSMGKTGLLSRLAGEFFGCAVTFGANGQVSAPGQVDMRKLRELLLAVHGLLEE